MTICDASTHDEIVFDEQRYRHISGEKCPFCRVMKEIEDLESRIKEFRDRK